MIVVCFLFCHLLLFCLPMLSHLQTVEPGIYFSPHLLAPVRDSKHIDHKVLNRYENVGGIRIEDVVLITKDGHENFTTVRSDVDWIEKVCSGEL